MADTAKNIIQHSPKALTGFLLLITMLGVFPIDVILPSFQAIAIHLDTGPNNIALSVGYFVLAMAFSQLVIGPLSDKLGRKRLLIWGLLVASIGALGCILTERYELFVVFRVIQAFGCGCFVLTQPLVQDFFDKTRRNAARIVQITASGLFISVSPLIGSWLQNHFSWHSSFIVFIALAALTLFAAQSLLEKDGTESSHGPSIVQSYANLMLDKLFIRYAILAALGFACHFSFIVASPLLFIKILHFTPYQFSVVFIFYGMAYILGGVAATLINRRVRSLAQLFIGIGLIAIAGVFIFVWHWIKQPSTPSLLLPMVLSTAGTCLCRCAATTCALECRPNEAGASSALLSALVFAVGAIASGFVSLLHGNLPVALGAVFLIVALTALWLIGTIRRATDGSAAQISP
ncbi:MFS transporter [Pseudomonas fulva]|uniref:MFS transporter n=1 Tax=Pseudomonas fulva TaxID=47880 RepID=UPI0018AC3F5D|nr:MFS transporter [Pseudomonas fulva]MBF8673220.1 MFS transporter [Pseudomonas fulva]MBF8695389.1 MFS transporter [Pseudomonas fulva]